MDDTREFYNTLFTKKQHAWANLDRDRFVYEIVANYITPTKVLDVGCGNGHTLAYFERKLPNISYTGLDISDVGLTQAKTITSAELINKSLEEWKTTRKFDLIINLGTIEHISDLDNSLLKLKHLLSKNGVCYFEAPNNLSYSPGEETFRRLTCGSRQMEWHLSRQSWDTKLINAGFTIVRRYKGFKSSWEFVWILG